MKRTTFRTLVFALLAAVAGGGSLAGWAEQTAPPSDVQTALLIEVRGLRAAMEKMVSAGPRVELALGRLQLQEQRITTLVRRLDDVKARLGHDRSEFDKLDRHLKRLAEGMRKEVNDSDFQHDPEVKEAKAELARLGAEVQRLSAEETLLAQDITAEQSRWHDFNQRLEELERGLGGR